jgi:hypothetical protein
VTFRVRYSDGAVEIVDRDGLDAVLRRRRPVFEVVRLHSRSVGELRQP